MSRTERLNKKTYWKCANRTTEVIRDPKIVDNLAINGYIGAAVCQKTVRNDGAPIRFVDRVDNLGEFDDREPGVIGSAEALYVRIYHLDPVFSQILGCNDCPYSKTVSYTHLTLPTKRIV